MRQHGRRAVVTGMGAVTPLGQSIDEYWRNLVEGKSGIGPLTQCDPSLYPSKIAGEGKDFDPVRYMSPKEARRMARFSQQAVAAAALAIVVVFVVVVEQFFVIGHSSHKIG